MFHLRVGDDFWQDTIRDTRQRGQVEDVYHLLRKNKKSQEKVIGMTADKVLGDKFEVGLSSSVIVEENYFRHLAKNHTKGGNLNPSRLDFPNIFLLEAG